MLHPESDRSNALTPPPEAVRQQLDKVTASTTFRRSPKLRALLGYLVTEFLRDGALVLKEYHIGTAIFRKPESFDPRSDPIVRVEAGRLRLKLRQYYAAEGASDPLEIAIPVGTYAPVFYERTPDDGLRPITPLPDSISVAVLPFKAMANPRDEMLASALAEQTAHALSAFRNFSVLAWNSVYAASGRKLQVASSPGTHKIAALLAGSVWWRRNTLIVSVELVHAIDGRLLWSRIYERSGNLDFELLRELAQKIATDMTLPEGSAEIPYAAAARAAV